jgi:hypothetical protein
MSSVRQSETGQLTIGRKSAAPAGGCLPGWMQECMDAQCGFLPAAPNPLSLSGAADWFAPDPRRVNSAGTAEPD